MTTRLAVLRLENARTLVAKEPTSPIVLLLILDEELTSSQMSHLCLATPYEPIMVVARVSDEWDGRGFPAEVVDVEILPSLQLCKQSRRARDGLVKRRRGGAVMEFD